MGIIRIVIQLVSAHHDGNIDPLQSRTLKEVPKTITEALSRFKLEGHTTVYAVCPACHYTHEPLVDAGSRTYPERCSSRLKPEDGLCNEPLLLESGGPIKPFVYHHFSDYLAGLLSQHEEVMDKACDNVNHADTPVYVNNVFDADFIRSFQGPLPNTLFIQRPGNEGRYLFAMNIDFFAVEGNRVRGASTSCGIISMACLNLPIEIRYEPENMYLVGIIPGPSEPALNELNHYMRPVVTDMIGAWVNGIRMSRTPMHSQGRNTRSAIALVVNDLPAARKTAALASHASHFYCSVCSCYHLSTRGSTNYNDWKARDHKEMRRHAEEWKDAATSVDRDKIFQATGVRWSELWRLPYWNPTRQLVVDSMHCILEGLAQHQSRDVLNLTTASAMAQVPVMPSFSHDFRQVSANSDEFGLKQNEMKHVSQIHDLLMAPIKIGDLVDNIEGNTAKLLKKLTTKNLAPLKFVCDDLGLVIHPNKFSKVITNPDGSTVQKCVLQKKDLAAALVEWVCSLN